MRRERQQTKRQGKLVQIFQKGLSENGPDGSAEAIVVAIILRKTRLEPHNCRFCGTAPTDSELTTLIATAALREGSMSAGWNVRTTTFSCVGNPELVRYFLSYEADKQTALERVIAYVPVNQGEFAEAVSEVSESELIGQGMSPGSVKEITP
jgi:hypothetical protein